MHIGILQNISIGTKWFIYIIILLTYDFPFIFYDDIAIDRELPNIDDVKQRYWGDEFRRWCDEERRRNNDALIRKGRRVDDRISKHPIDTDKLNGVTGL